MRLHRAASLNATQPALGCGRGAITQWSFSTELSAVQCTHWRRSPAHALWETIDFTADAAWPRGADVRVSRRVSKFHLTALHSLFFYVVAQKHRRRRYALNGAPNSVLPPSRGWCAVVMQSGGIDCTFERTAIDTLELLQVTVANSTSASGGGKLSRAQALSKVQFGGGHRAVSQQSTTVLTNFELAVNFMTGLILPLRFGRFGYDSLAALAARAKNQS